MIRRNPVLEDWEFIWNDRLATTMGRMCISSDRKKKWIELSTKIVSLNTNTPNFLEKIRQTIIHEWCHALDYELYGKVGHGPTWKALMIYHGIPAERCFDSFEWLCKPNGKKYAIRHESGKVIVYLMHNPCRLVVEAAKRRALKRNLTTALELINLEDGLRRAMVC